MQPEPFNPEILASLPHPLAANCAIYNQAENDTARFQALDRLLQAFVKYLMAVALSQYWHETPDKEKLVAWLHGLEFARLLTSLHTLDQLSDEYQSCQQESYLYPALFEKYLTPVDASSAIGKAWQTIADLDRSTPQSVSEAITPRGFLGHLLAFRQTRWEGASFEAEAILRDQLLPILYSASVQLLTLFKPLFRYRLLYIERIDRDGQDWLYTMVEFSGSDGKPVTVPVPFRERGLEDSSYKANRLYICSPQNQPLLDLHPLIISHFYEIYFLEYSGEEKVLWYSHCSSPKRYNPPDHYRFLSTQFKGSSEEDKSENDLVIDLKQASDDLVHDESSKRIEEMPFSILSSYLSPEAKDALEIGLGEALRIGQFWLGIEFLLMGLSKQEDSLLARKLVEINVDKSKFRAALRGLLGVKTKDWQKQRNVQEVGTKSFSEIQEGEPIQWAELYYTKKLPKVVITPRLLSVLREAVRLASGRKVSTIHLLLAALQHHQSLPINLLFEMIVEAKQDPNQWVKKLTQEVGATFEQKSKLAADVFGTKIPRSLIAINALDRLGRMGRDLTALAQAGQLRPAIGESAHKAMVQIALVLQQKEANNPILLGETGVGKTAIVEGLAWRLANDKDVISKLSEKRIVDISSSSLLAGTKYRSDLEERVLQLLSEVRSAQGKIIIFFDETHTILGGRAEGGLSAISDVLKPALSRGEFPCIGATTIGEYRRYIESDPALARGFTPIWLEEPTHDEAMSIAKEVARQHLAPSHHVEYPDDVIREAVRLSVRYLHDESLPGKVIKLLDQAGPRVTMEGSLRGMPADKSIVRIVTQEIVGRTVSERTGIPLTSLSQDDRDKIRNLESKLKERVKGQDEAVNEVARVVKRSRAGLADPHHPSGVFLFAGPTGVGKTEFALTLAEALFDQEDAILRLDMSEYLDGYQISRLTGSPLGYVGHDEEGQLTGRLRRRPYSVILLDEFEKAHKDVQHLFLQLFDAGRITDSLGRTADGRNAIFIMTTNLGTKEAMGLIANAKSYKQKLQTAIEEHFSAEFLNSISRIVYFEPLTQELLLAIFDKFFAQAVERFRIQNIEVTVAEEFKRALCEKYIDIKRGARPLQRAIEDEIIAPLADKIISGEISPGMKITVGEKS